MRKLTLKYIAQLIEHRHQEGSLSGGAPAPFPGKYPTWIAFQLVLAGNNNIEYLGKPTRLQVERFHRELEQPRAPSTAWAVEFDRKNIISVSGTSGAFSKIPDGIRWYNPLLHAAYHPWQLNGWYLQPFLTLLYVKSLGGFKVYSPYAKLKNEFIIEFKQWMLHEFNKKLKGSIPVPETPKRPRSVSSTAAEEEFPTEPTPEIRSSGTLDMNTAQQARPDAGRRLQELRAAMQYYRRGPRRQLP